MRPQFALGDGSVGVVVSCVLVPAMVQLQDHFVTVAPEAVVDALPSKVQSRAFPPPGGFGGVSRHTLLPPGPLTVNRAMTTGGDVVTLRVAVFVTPASEALIVTLLNVPPTARVLTVKVVLDAPAGTVTLAGTVTGSADDSAIVAPPVGAGPVSDTVPVTEFPPMTVVSLSRRLA